MSTYIRKNNVTHEQKEMPMLFPADRVYLDGDTTKTVQETVGSMDSLKIVDIPYSDFSWNSGIKAYVTSQDVTMPTGYSLVGFIVTATNSADVLAGRFGSGNQKVQVLGWTPLTAQSIDSTHTFTCKMILVKS